MCSFDDSYLFTNVSLDEIIKICLEVLYDKSDSQPIFPKDVFVELMKNATSSVEFSFNNTVYKQTDGVAMRSPLGPALVDIFFGYYEEKPPIYFKYVDDTFAIFDHEVEVDKLLSKLNCLHPSLKFTFEKEEDKCLPFLEVYVQRTDICFKTCVYPNPLSLAQYFYVGSP